MADDENRGRRRPYSSHSPGTSSKKVRTESGGAVNVPHEQPSTSAGSRQRVECGDEKPTPARHGDKKAPHYEIIQSRSNVDQPTKIGTTGDIIRLKANYFRLLTKPLWTIFHYHIDFEPEIENRRLRGGVLSQHSQLLGTGYIFDGKQVFTTVKLDEPKIVLKCKSKVGEEYTITIKMVGQIEMTDWQSLQVLNLIKRRAMEGLKLELVGRNFFDPAEKTDLEKFHMQIWPGYETSIRKHEYDILLCSEVTHKVMRTETVYDILTNLSGGRGGTNYQEEFQRTVIGLIVLTDYNNKTYRINDVSFTMTPQSTFDLKGTPTTFLEYYKKRYNIHINDPRQPMLISKCRDKAMNRRSNDSVILVPELCRATGLTDRMRSDYHLMSEMAKTTRVGPQKRIERLLSFNNRLQRTTESVKVLRDWNMTLDENLVELQGRVFARQKLILKNNKVVYPDERSSWNNAFRTNAMFITPSRGLYRWTMISPEQSIRTLRSFLESLCRVAHAMGFEINPRPMEILLRDDRNTTYVGAIQESARSDPQFILCLVPNNNVERYNSIKKKSYIELGIPTQVVTQRVAGNNRGLMSVASKVAIQINSKLGYTPWMIEIPLSGLMTIGFDIAKSARDHTKAYAALVASMDLKTNATFYSTVVECSAYDLMANSMWVMIMKALHQFQREHKALPARILLYRDGISSGSLKQVFEHEVKEIVSKLTEQYKKFGKEPKFAYIVVTKSMNTRIFHHRGDGEPHQNPPPGTVVDDVITLPEWFDFYLVSQHVGQGTVAPTAYNVIYSSIGLTPDRLQLLTYIMSHLYFNWSGTTRVPAVIQYAKKLATLVATNLHQVPHTALEKKFFYL